MSKRSKPSIASQEYEISYTELMALSPRDALISFHVRHDQRSQQLTEFSDQTKACIRGCSYCCHFKVVVDAVEVFAMIDYVKTNLNQQHIDQIIQSAKYNIEEAKILSHEEQATINQKCPFLRDNVCVAYPARSIKCRNFHATDANNCRASYENPKDLTILNNSIPELYIASTGSSEGFMAALHASGYDDRIYDFNSAFIEAIESPECESRYNNRKRAFKTAKYNN